MSTDDEDPRARQPRAVAEAQPDDGFQAFLEAFAPVLRAGPEEGGELAAGPDDDVAAAAQVAARFFTEENALRIFPPEAREQLGSAERWRWCLLYVRCCWMFGWLVCRGCRDFRALAYYLYRYWLCVREAVGTPVNERQLSDAERRDADGLIAAFGEIYQAWLQEEELNVKLHSRLTDELTAGRFDCCRDERFAGMVFERLLSPANAQLILGRDALEKHRRDPFFWLCRCWCMAAVRFGCCLACARTRAQLLRCYREYGAAVGDCFRPLRCELTGPHGCVADELEQKVGGFAVPVTGTAAGAFFAGYTVEWRMVEGEPCGQGGWRHDHVMYPGGGSAGAVPVVNGLLAWLDTSTFTARSYEVRVCPRSSAGAQPACCCTQFNLFKHFVWIDAVAGAPVAMPPGPFDAHAEVTDGAGHVVPVGCRFTVHGSAWVGECNERKIQCFDLRWGVGCLPGPTEKGFDPAAFTGSLLPGPVCYTAPDEDCKRAQWNQVINGTLTTQLAPVQITLFPGSQPITLWKLQDFCFDSAQHLPACPDRHHPCHSGRYTLLVDAWDTLGNHYYDTQCVWVDNQPIHAQLVGFDGVPNCSRMSLRGLAGTADCNKPWLGKLMGVAFDELIDPFDPTYPSDNFDFYAMSITRGCAGGPTWQIPITPDLVHFHADPLTGVVNQLHGTSRVGDPGSRCWQTAGCPAGPPTWPVVPPHFFGPLTAFDLRAFDAVCSTHLAAPFAPPAGFALARGECCPFTIQLYVRDRTRSDCSGGCHEAWAVPCAIYLCNDLPHETAAGTDAATQPALARGA